MTANFRLSFVGFGLKKKPIKTDRLNPVLGNEQNDDGEVFYLIVFR